MRRPILTALAVLLTVVGLSQASRSPAAGADASACEPGRVSYSAARGRVVVTREETMRLRYEPRPYGVAVTLGRWVEGRVRARVTIAADACPGGTSRVATATSSARLTEVRQGSARGVWGPGQREARVRAESRATRVAKAKIVRCALRQLAREALADAMAASAGSAGTGAP